MENNHGLPLVTYEGMVYYKGHKSGEVSLARSGVRSQNNSIWSRTTGLVELAPIADKVAMLFRAL